MRARPRKIHRVRSRYRRIDLSIVRCTPTVDLHGLTHSDMMDEQSRLAVALRFGTLAPGAARRTW